MAFQLVRELLENKMLQAGTGKWYNILFATPGQEETIRQYAGQQGFKNLRGFYAWMTSRDWDYYDVIKVSCREE